VFNSGSNESSVAPQFKWLEYTFNIGMYSILLVTNQGAGYVDRYNKGGTHVPHIYHNIMKIRWQGSLIYVSR
jgi:hypothetical protein